MIYEEGNAFSEFFRPEEYKLLVSKILLQGIFAQKLQERRAF